MKAEWEDRWDDPRQGERLIDGLKAIFSYDEVGFFHVPGRKESTMFLIALPGITRKGFAMVRTSPNQPGFREMTLKKAFGLAGDRWIQLCEEDFVSFAKHMLEQERRHEEAAPNVVWSPNQAWWRNKGEVSPEPQMFRVPEPNVRLVAVVADKFTWEDARSIYNNPLIAGAGNHSQQIPDEDWVPTAAEMLRKDGTEQWLVNMLFLLRAQLGQP